MASVHTQFEAILTEGGPARAVTNYVRFQADAIAGSLQTWWPRNPGGRPWAWGNRLFATLTYFGLPLDNSAFGVKMARVKLLGETKDSKCFWTFYLADAYNHPGGHPTPDPEEPPKKVEPNYFYYYRQTSARYGNPIFDYNRSRQTWPWEYCPPRHTEYYVEIGKGRPHGPIPSPGANAGQLLRYIDRFAWACRHEVKHSENYVAWWGPQCYSKTNDADVWPAHPTHGDAIPNAIEPNLRYEGQPYDPTNPFTFAGREEVLDDWDDDQLYTSMNAEVWTKEQQDASFADDWAKPGKNWPDRP
jgi:hypothetical protein